MSKIAKTTIALMIITILSKVLGFGREIMLGSVYGATQYADVYLVALEIPAIIIASIATAISTTYIPLFYDIKEECGEERAMKFTNNLVNIVAIMCIIFVLLGLIFTKSLVKVIAFGFEGETLQLAVKFTRVLLLATLFIGIGYITTSYLQIKDNFAIPGLIGLPYNIIIIISIYLSVKYNIYILAWGTLIAYASQLIIQLPYAKKNGFKYKLELNLKDKYLKEMIIIVTPIFIGVAVNQINALIDKSLASTLAEGSIAALNYANKLNWFIITIFIASIASVIYPKIAELSTKNKKEQLLDTITTCVNTVVLLVVPISVGAIILANPIVKILFQRGEFDERAVKMTSIALVFYSLGMLAFGLRDVLSRAFYALKDTKTPMINGSLAMILNILLNIMLIRFMGHGGLALATSISSTVTVILLFISLKRKIDGFDMSKIINTLLKVIVTSLIMGLVTHISYIILENRLGEQFIYDIVNLVISVIIGAITYAIIIINMKIDEVNLVIGRMNSLLYKFKLKKKK